MQGQLRVFEVERLDGSPEHIAEQVWLTLSGSGRTPRASALVCGWPAAPDRARPTAPATTTIVTVRGTLLSTCGRTSTPRTASSAWVHRRAGRGCAAARPEFQAPKITATAMTSTGGSSIERELAGSMPTRRRPARRRPASPWRIANTVDARSSGRRPPSRAARPPARTEQAVGEHDHHEERQVQVGRAGEQDRPRTGIDDSSGRVRPLDRGQPVEPGVVLQDPEVHEARDPDGAEGPRRRRR